MKQDEWMETWQRLKSRFPIWQPTAIEAEDWCIGLKVYPVEVVEDVSRWVKSNYSSNTPAMKWFIVQCEKRKNEARQNQLKRKEVFVDHRAEHLSRSEATIQRLKNTDIDDLRDACRTVLKRYPFVAKPTCGNPREWKNSLRSLVFLEIYGDKAQ
tara:strand:+ start:236 stop:700 length:465 start_codon:yes stop_codon:yes gene_type:complete